MVITCSDTRTPETDTSGQLIQKLLKEQGHSIAAYHLVKDEPAQIKGRIAEGLAAQASHGGIRHSKPWMPCWKNGWMDSEKSFAI